MSNESSCLYNHRNLMRGQTSSLWRRNSGSAAGSRDLDIYRAVAVLVLVEERDRVSNHTSMCNVSTDLITVRVKLA